MEDDKILDDALYKNAKKNDSITTLASTQASSTDLKRSLSDGVVHCSSGGSAEGKIVMRKSASKVETGRTQDSSNGPCAGTSEIRNVSSGDEGNITDGAVNSKSGVKLLNTKDMSNGGEQYDSKGGVSMSSNGGLSSIGESKLGSKPGSAESSTQGSPGSKKFPTAKKLLNTLKRHSNTEKPDKDDDGEPKMRKRDRLRAKFRGRKGRKSRPDVDQSDLNHFPIFTIPVCTFPWIVAFETNEPGKQIRLQYSMPPGDGRMWYRGEVEEKFGEQNFRVFSEMRGKFCTTTLKN